MGQLKLSDMFARKTPTRGTPNSIPSTPPRPVATPSSSRCGAAVRRLPRPVERIPETPPQPQPSRAHLGPGLQNPDRPSLLPAWDSSPLVSIDISSADESSDGEVRVAARLAARKRKLDVSIPARSLSAKRTKTSQDASSPSFALQHQPRPRLKIPDNLPKKSPPASTASPSQRRRSATPVSRIPRPVAKLQRPVSSSQPAFATSSQFANGAEDEDCFIERTQKSPAKRRPGDSIAIQSKRRQLSNGSAAAVGNQPTIEVPDSDCEILKVVTTPDKPLPRKAGRPVRKSQDEDKDPKQESPSSTMAPPSAASEPRRSASCPRAPIAPSPSLTQVEKSPVIDLTQEETSASDSDEYEDALESQSSTPLP